MLKIFTQKANPTKPAETTEMQLILAELGAGLHLVYLLSFSVPVI